MTTYLTDYLLKWGFSSLVLLSVYKLVLEKQVMHHLKRIYLLGTLLLPLGMPFVTFDVPVTSLPFPIPGAQLTGEPPAKPAPQLAAPLTVDGSGSAPLRSITAAEATPLPLKKLLYGLYGTVTLLMLIRLGRNLYRLIRQVRCHPTQPLGRATLVRLPGNGLPYTFLRYVFVSDAAYRRGELEPELLTHELTHIRQWHSVDVLLVEIVRCFGWFNPLLIGLKRAIQLNHEFLADQAVTTTYRNVIDYQRLLLSKLTPAVPALALTSTLIFQTTKQRLLMMTQPCFPARQWLAAAGTALLFATLTVSMTVRTIAQQVPAPPQSVTKPAAKTAATAPPYGRALTQEEIGRWHADKKVHIHGGEPGLAPAVLFRDLTPDQKKRVVHLVTEPRKQPTEAQWKEWQNTRKYGLWVNEKRRRDDPLDNQYKLTDIVYFWSSYVHKNARQPEGYFYQLELYTEDGYPQLLKHNQEHPSLYLRKKESTAPKATR